jgi:hypothetical protein
MSWDVGRHRCRLLGFLAAPGLGEQDGAAVRREALDHDAAVLVQIQARIRRFAVVHVADAGAQTLPAMFGTEAPAAQVLQHAAGTGVFLIAGDPQISEQGECRFRVVATGAASSFFSSVEKRVSKVDSMSTMLVAGLIEIVVYSYRLEKLPKCKYIHLVQLSDMLVHIRVLMRCIFKQLPGCIRARQECCSAKPVMGRPAATKIPP